ncbi:hypothetical protein [Hyphococcus sp.]|uniref:hypothetical protein n=1 Tax=Hyphococcus sp. TaxID=2038636 RepID=UPI003CCBBA1B
MSPALELAHCRPEVASSFNGHGAWLDTGAAEALLVASIGNLNTFISTDGRQGMISVAEISRNATAWTDFAIKLKAAAGDSGFSSDHGGKLLAAVKEFFSNVIEHSEKIETGQVLFSARLGRFEIVVRDRGIGVLESLRKNPKYADLNDGGSAIELALQEGVSRHAEEPGHGFGFRPVFIGLANVSEYIRFRSGDHCREFFQKPGGSIDAHTKQSSGLDGFSCTVICTPNSV